MKRLKFTEQQIAFALQQAESERRLPWCAARWGSRSDLLSLEATLWRLNAIRGEEVENMRLRRVVADLTVDKEMLQEVIRRKL